MVSDSTSSTPSEPKLCAKGCGFYGSSSTLGLCSTCFGQEKVTSATVALDWLSINDEVTPPPPPTLVLPSPAAADQVTSATVALDWLSIKDGIFAPSPPSALPSPAAVEDVVLPPRDKCHTCDKRIKLGQGFNCRCGFSFCVPHRYPEEHRCLYDYKAKAKLEIMKSNPKVKADKIDRI